MHPIGSIGAGANQIQQTQSKSQSQTVSNSGISFNAVFEGLQNMVKSGVMAVADKNSAHQSNWNRDKLDIEKKRQWKTDMEEAQDILGKIAKIIDEHKNEDQKK